MPLTLTRADLVCTQNFINGQWVSASGSSTFQVLNPASQGHIANVPDSSAADGRAAASAAHAAFPAWRVTPARERSQLLKRWFALFVKHKEDLARLISLEQGKPLPESVAEVLYAASYVEWFAEEATRAYGDLIPAPVKGRRMTVVKEPVGVIAAISPWNFPAAMIARKIAPALAAGCTVLAKPAEDTPLTALALVRLAEEAGVPPGVLNIVTASRERTRELVDTWLTDSRVRKISFTGSTRVGKSLAQESAATLKRLSLELGGNAPFIVFDDADVTSAVDGLMTAKFRNGGQTCVSPNRIFVQAGVHDRFVEALSKRVAALRIGPADDVRSQIGPMINSRAVTKLEEHIADALANGASLKVGGHRSAMGASFFEPTVLTGCNPKMRVFHEETFGPVASIFQFDSEEEAVAMANDTVYGLAAYIYSEKASRCSRVADQLECGIVGVNEGAVSSELAPFGGVKESGYGREGSSRGLDEYVQTKYLCEGRLD